MISRIADSRSLHYVADAFSYYYCQVLVDGKILLRALIIKRIIRCIRSSLDITL